MKIEITLSKDGNTWIALIGPNLQEGIAAHGDTAMEAIRALGGELSVAADVELGQFVPELAHHTRTEYTTRSGRLTIREAFNGFYVTLNGHPNHHRTTAGCGDGTGNWILPEDIGLPEEEFKSRMWSRIIQDIEGSESDWLQGYFGVTS